MQKHLQRMVAWILRFTSTTYWITVIEDMTKRKQWNQWGTSIQKLTTTAYFITICMSGVLSSNMGILAMFSQGCFYKENILNIGETIVPDEIHICLNKGWLINIYHSISLKLWHLCSISACKYIKHLFWRKYFFYHYSLFWNGQIWS